MATKFQVWIDTPGDSNTLSSTELKADSQRTSGFVAGSSASSSRVNSMLRQNSLAVAALMDLIGPSSNVDLRSSMTDVKAVMSEYFGQSFVAASYDEPSNSIIFTTKSGTTVSVSISQIVDTTVARAKADQLGNVIDTTYATKAYVTRQIGAVLDTAFPTN